MGFKSKWKSKCFESQTDFIKTQTHFWVKDMHMKVKSKLHKVVEGLSNWISYYLMNFLPKWMFFLTYVFLVVKLFLHDKTNVCSVGMSNGN